MPKATTKTPLRFAPYVPLRRWKVFTQLSFKKEEPVIHELVQQMGGTVSEKCEPGVNYVVSEEGGAGCLSEKVIDFVDTHDGKVTVIEKQCMLEQLKDMCGNMCPATRFGELLPTLKYRDLLFPVRVDGFPRIGTVFPEIEFQDFDFSIDHVSDDTLQLKPVVDILYVVSPKGETDVWSESVQMHRYQVMAKKKGKKFYAIKTCNSLFHLCHGDTFHSSAKAFKSKDDAMSFLFDGDLLLEGTDVKTLKPGVMSLPEDEVVYVEVLKVWWPEEAHELSDYEPVEDSEE